MERSYHVNDNDFGKGAFEEDGHGKSQTSMSGQLPHRGADPEAEGLDTDFPEPGGNPEHSGEPEEKPVRRPTKSGPVAA